MNERPTPETDCESGFFDMETGVSADFARRLERERDEARDELKKLEGAYEDATNYYARIIELTYERDETRKEVKYWQELYRTVSVY